MTTKARWIALLGRMELDGDLIVFKGGTTTLEDGQPGFEIGNFISDQYFGGGIIRATIQFSERHGRSAAGLILHYHPQLAGFIEAQLGGPFLCSLQTWGGQKWVTHGATGSADQLQSGVPYEFEVRVMGSRVGISLNGVHRIRNNHTTPISIREDGITSLNLQDLYQLQSQEFTVIDFSPHVESSTTGADWEWWFMQPGRHFGAAVQAKVLTTAQDYDIGYVPKNGYPQIRRLLDYSKTNGVAPMYCFYNWWQVPPARHWPCGSFVKQEDLWGCALADAFNVWRLHLRQKNTLADLHKYTMPWHCIVCCPGHVSGGPEGPSTRAFGITRVLRRQSPGEEPSVPSQEEDEYREFPEPHIVEELPERISVLRRYVQSHESIGRDLIFKLFGETPPRQVILQGAPEKE